MKSVCPKLALCGGINVCARTDTVFFLISEVSDGTVSLKKTQNVGKKTVPVLVQ